MSMFGVVSVEGGMVLFSRICISYIDEAFHLFESTGRGPLQRFSFVSQIWGALGCFGQLSARLGDI